MSELTVPTYRLTTPPIQEAIQSAIWGRDIVIIQPPSSLAYGGVSLGDIIITNETQWTDRHGTPVYNLVSTSIPTLAGSPAPYKLVTKL